MTQAPTKTSAPDRPAWTAGELAENPHLRHDKAERVRRMFASIAHRYDLNNRIHSLGLDLVWRARAVRFSQVQPTDDVLDVACGTGDLTFAFARAQPRRIVGLDFTEEMLEIARDKAHRLSSQATTPTFMQGDAMALPFDDQSFDVVSIAFGIRNVSDPAKALAEFHRVLRPGGRLVVLEFSQPRNRVVRWCNNVYTTRIMPATATLIARDDSGAYRYLPKSVETFHDVKSLGGLMMQSGFTQPQVFPQTFGVCSITIATPLAASRRLP
jgi:demethylmenaquinone methyltransferase / 2-methoxy-6-polyprenyl-1,4-benzoquinol methylase